MVPEFTAITRTDVEEGERTESEGDNWGCAAIIMPLAVGIGLWTTQSLWWGIIGAIASLIVVAIVLFKVRSTWFSRQKVIPAKTKQVTESKQIAEHRCCIQCRHPVKALR